ECSLVEAAVQFQTKPGAGEQRGQPDQEQFDGVRRDRTLGSDPKRAHQEDRDRYRLKHRALDVLGPAAEAAPDDDEDAGKPSDAAEHAVEEADAGIERRSARLDRTPRRTNHPLEAVAKE